MALSLTVNGDQHSLDIEGDTPLLWVLRDELGLKGTKFGCGVGLCGACTVHLNGLPVRSCSTRVESVAGGDVTTIEAWQMVISCTPCKKRGLQRVCRSVATVSLGR